MSVSQLPNKRWRAQVYDPATRRSRSVAEVLGLTRGERTFKTQREAKEAREKARTLLYATSRERASRMTVGEFYDVWTSSVVFEAGANGQPRKGSTLSTYHQAAKGFVAAHRSMALVDVSEQVAASWLARARPYTIYGLQVMFSDASSKRAGRIISHNPFAGMGVRRGSRANVQPPSEEQVWEMVCHARRLCGDDFAGWLQFAAFTGCRPAEIDGLERSACDVRARRAVISQQWSKHDRRLTTPKNGKPRRILLPPPAVEALEGVDPTRWAFTTHRGTHFSASSRSVLWDRVRTAMGWLDTDSRVVLYTATRHFAGWYFYEVLGLDAEDVAIQLGHEDHGELIRKLYGHKSRDRALDRMELAFAKAGSLRDLRAVESA